jgi:choline dehydrogenase-like flavoprotein
MSAHRFSYYDTEILGPALNKLGATGHSCPRATPSRPYRGRSECLACRICKFCPTGARYSPDRVHVPALHASPNVTIVENASLRRLETGPSGDRIVAAHAIRTDDETELVIRADRFVLAMGGVETPRMLMLSADGGAHKEGLGNAGGQLGKHFSDHLNPYVTVDLGRHVGVRLGFETMITEHFRAQGDRDKQPGYLIFSSPAMDWFPVGVEATDWAIRDDVLHMDEVRASIPRMATLATMTEIEGKGVIELDQTTTDAFGAPVAKVTANLTDWDRAGNDALGRLAPQLAEAMGAKNVSEVSPPEAGLGFHPSGTTAMAKHPDQGVCDTNLKVFGLDNLYLVSNSVFPQMGPNPPTLAIAALGLRLADHLEGRTSR